MRKPRTQKRQCGSSNVREFLAAETEMIRRIGRTPRNGFVSLGHLVLTYGIQFQYAPLPKGINPGKLQQCFANATALSDRRRGELIYVEGYCAGLIPMMHAFCVDEHDRVVDNTWCPPHCSPGQSYFGIPFRRDYMATMQLRTGYYGMLDQWEANWPIFEVAHQPEKFIHPRFLDRCRTKALTPSNPLAKTVPAVRQKRP